MTKGGRFRQGFETFVYILACILSVGIVYVWRIVITRAILMANMTKDDYIQKPEISKV